MLKEIKHKLKKFIIRYHLNQMIRGTILAVSGLLAVALVVLVAEYFGYFNTTFRAVLVFSYLGFAAVVVYQSIIKSLLRIYGLSGTMSDMEASEYIGRYLPEVSDKLTNLLQLSQIKDISEEQKQFLDNAINQKAIEIKPFDFKKIIDFRINRKYLKYLAIPAVVAVILVISAPNVITEPGKRLATFNVEYEKPQPFYIELVNENPRVVEGGNLKLHVKLSGEQRPEKLFIERGNERLRLQRDNADSFSIELKNVRNQKRFVITDGIVSSKEYQIAILRKPEILGYEILLDYPAYMGRKDEVTSNNGDLIVPCGTKIQWQFNARNTREIDLYILGEKKSMLSGDFAASTVAMEDFGYQLVSKNEHVTSDDTMRFSVTVTPDQYPEIELRLTDDSSSNDRVFVNGLIGDDYGFSGLVFAWKKRDDESFNIQQIQLEQGIRKQVFYHSFRKDTLLGPGEEIEYYFEVKDNDRVKGPKSARSEILVIKQETEEEIEQQIEKKSKDFKNKAKETSEEFKKLNEKFEEMRKKIVSKENLDWEDKEAIRKLLERSEELQMQMEQLKRDLEQQNKEEDRIQEKNEEILKKEEELKELMEKVLDKELLKKIEELKELLKKNNKDKIRESMEDMNEQNMDLEKELERSLELFKRLEVEKELQDAINELDKLKEEQQQAIEAEKKDKAGEQKKVNEDFEKLQQKLDEVRKKDKELEMPMGVEKTSEEEKQVDQKLNEAMENLNKGKNRKGGEKQQQAKQEMQKLSDKLQQMMMEMQSKSNAEDMKAMRELLENIVKLSVDQEALMDEFKKTSKDDPRFVGLIEDQKDLKLDLQKVKDSLYALSKRQLMIQSFINKEVGDIDRNMEKGMDAMLALNTIGYTRQRDRDEAVIRQQYVMKGLNNIALMLSESMEQMKQQMRKQGKKMGNKSCNNPKPGQSSKPSMKQMQQQLNGMLEQMKKDMENGKKAGKKGKSMSEKFARSAAQQREIRKKLEELRQQMQEQGNPNGKSIGKTLEEMEKTEESLVNKILNENTLKRQQEILTRLLEHEKAKREQEFEKKRKSEEAKSQNDSNPDEFLEYKRIKEKETELLRMVPPELAPFYRNKLNEYYINLGR